MRENEIEELIKYLTKDGGEHIKSENISRPWDSELSSLLIKLYNEEAKELK